MQSLFDQSAADSLILRIEQLTPESQPGWGKMGVSQMLAHCSSTMEVVRDQKHIKRVFVGYLFGGLLKKHFFNDKPFKQNSPTHPYFIHSDTATFEQEKQSLINHLRAFQEGGPGKCTRQPHAFFGKLNEEQWATGMYKHTDHHLQQFGV